MKLFDLKEKIAIVTGASRGLGKAMALGLAEAGANVVVTDILDTKDAVDGIKELGVKAIGLKVDVTSATDIAAAVKLVKEKFGKIDILVNNAGVFKPTPAGLIEQSDWDKIIKVNLKGQMLCTEEVGKYMIEHKSGKIINIASVAGKFANEGSVAYNVSKAGVILLTKTLAVEWAKYNIYVNAICPGCFRTPMTEDFLKDENFVQTIKTKTPLGRCGEPEELAGAVVFLASDASSYLTGHALVIDGGWTAGL